MVHIAGLTGLISVRRQREWVTTKKVHKIRREKERRRQSEISSRSLPIGIHGRGGCAEDDANRRKSYPLRTHQEEWPEGESEPENSPQGGELPNGRNAWPGGSDSRRSSKRRGGGKNKVGDVSSIANASAAQEAADPAAKYNQNGVVNVVLYVGFALTGLGMILTFVGMGEVGFKTKELQLIGPSLIACGILFIVLRIMFCSFNCKFRDSKRLDEKSLLSPSQETLIEDRQSTPPPHSMLTEVLTPLKETESLRPETAVATDEYPQNHPPAPEDIQKLIEDEVESDAELGLEVQYIGEDDKPKSPSQSVNKSVASNNGSHGARSNIPHLDASFNEVLLDPTKLDPSANG